MKKEIYFCDRCGKQLIGKGNHVILDTGLEKLEKDLCDNCTNEIVNFFLKENFRNNIAKFKKR